MTSRQFECPEFTSGCIENTPLTPLKRGTVANFLLEKGRFRKAKCGKCFYRIEETLESMAFGFL